MLKCLGSLGVLKQGSTSILERLGGSSTLEQGSPSMLEYLSISAATLEHTSMGSLASSMLVQNTIFDIDSIIPGFCRTSS